MQSDQEYMLCHWLQCCDNCCMPVGAAASEHAALHSCYSSEPKPLYVVLVLLVKTNTIATAAFLILINFEVIKAHTKVP
jgi:hypothetical protein